MTFSFNFLHAVTFLHVLHLDVLRGQIEIELIVQFGGSFGATIYIGLVHVSLILLGWELHDIVSCITVLCVQGIPILSPLIFMPSLYSTF